MSIIHDYFHQGASPKTGEDVLLRLRRANPAARTVTLSELICATASSPPDAQLAAEALRHAGVSVEDDPSSLDTKRAGRALDDDDEAEEGPDTVRGSSSRPFDDEQPDVHDDDAEEKRRNDALAIELASGSPAVIYLREISRARLLTADEEISLARAVRSGHEAEESLGGDPGVKAAPDVQKVIDEGRAARRRLIESNLRLVVSVARRYVGRGMAFLDLVQEGNLGLNRGIDKYDPERGYRFSTYVYWWIRQAITRAIADHGRTIRLPVHIIDFLTQVQRASHELAHETGIQPTPAEIADRLNTTEVRVSEALRAGQLPVSLESPVGAEQESVLSDLLADQTAQQPPDTAMSSMLREYVNEVLGDVLSLRERAVLELRFGLQDDRIWSLSEIGLKLGISRERVRQIEHEALAKLRRPNIRNKLADYME